LIDLSAHIFDGDDFVRGKANTWIEQVQAVSCHDISQ